MTKIPKSVREEIAALPGGDGWWRSSGQDTHEELAADLMAHGYSGDDAVALLSAAFSAAAAARAYDAAALAEWGQYANLSFGGWK